MSSHFIHRLIYFVQEEGFKAFIVRALKRVISPIFKFERALVLEKSLSEDIKPLPPKIPVNIRQIYLQDDGIERVGELMYHDRAFIEKRLEKGKRCFVAEVNGKIAHYVWLSFREESIPEINKVLVLGEKEAYFFNARTLRQFRDQGLFAATLSEMLQYLKDKGYKRVLCSMSHKNIASLKPHEKTGWQTVCVITYFKFFLFKKYICITPAGEKFSPYRFSHRNKKIVIS